MALKTKNIKEKKMSEEKNVKVKATLSPATIFLYGLGGMFPYGWILVITGYYFLFFMTDILSNTMVEIGGHGHFRHCD